MKKKLLQIFIGILFFSCSSTKNVDNSSIETKEKTITYDYAGKVDNNQLRFIKTNYNWNTEKVLIINYKQPLSICHFDNHKISKGNKWWKKFYSKIDTENCANIHVLANGEIKNKNIDNKNIFDDKNDFLLSNFFNRKTSCFGVLVVDNEGYYIQYNGHYSERQVSKYIENLKQ
jgi:hypothetical protein